MKTETASPTALALILLADIGEAISANLPLDDILERIVGALIKLMPSCDAASILIPDKQMQTVRFRASIDRWGEANPHLKSLTLRIEDLPTVQTILETGETLYIPDVHISPLWVESLSTANGQRRNSRHVLAVLGIPLIVTQQIVGFLFVDFYRVDPLTADARYAALAFARYAATAIAMAEQRDDLRRSEERYRLISRLTSNAIYDWTPSAANMEWSSDIDALLHYQPGGFPRTVEAWKQAIHPFERAHIAEAREKALRANVPFEAEYRLQRADGEYCRVMDRAMCFQDQSALHVLGAISDVSDVYVLADALMSSEVRYRTVFAHSMDAIFVIDRDGHIIDLNPAAEQMTGREAPDLLNQSLLDLIAPPEIDQYREMLHFLYSRNAFSNREMRLIRADRGVIYVEMWGTELSEGIYQVVAHDVSARQREQILIAQRTAELMALGDLTRATAGGGDLGEMLWRALPGAMNALEVPIGGIYFRQGQTTNLLLRASVGFEPGQLALYPAVLPIGAANRGRSTGASVLVRILDSTPDDGLYTSIQVPLISGREIIGLVVFSHKEERTFLATDIRLMDIIGQQLEIGIENVRLLAELESLVQERTSELLATELRYKSLIEQVPGVVYSATGVYSGLAFVSSGAADLFGLSVVQMLQNPDSLWACIHQDDQTRIREIAEGAMAQDAEFDAQYRIINAQTHTERWVHHRARRINTAKGEKVWLGLLSDVSRLKELDNLKNQFVATVSHELRTPLTAIKLRATTLRNYYDRLAEHERLDMLSRIIHQSDILADLIEDVLRVSRLDSGSREHLHWGRVDVIGVGCDVIEELSASAQSSDLTLNVTWPPDHYTAYADPTDITRIWRNLISNAIKYTPGPGHITIAADCVTIQDGTPVTPSIPLSETLIVPPGIHAGQWVIGIVSDTGKGISEQDQAHIFTRFYRGDAALTNIPGSGLGLSLVKELLEEYQGYITFRSQLGLGSTFTFWLPAAGDDNP